MNTMLASDLPLEKIGRGKVRDIYAVDADRLLLVTTDRISAFDVVMAETIPMKGAVLTQISAWWFGQLEGVVPHHMISADADEIIRKVPALKDGGETIFESGAVALFLTDKYRKVKLGPAAADPKRGEYLSWLFYRPGIMEPAFMERRFNIQHVNGAMGWAQTEEVEQVLNDHLAKNKYFLGEEFSAADIMLGGGIYFMMLFKMTPETDVFKEYTARITSRPAFRRMMERDQQK